MKTWKNATLAAIIAIIGVVGFVGCGGDDTTHTHDWGDWEVTPATETEDGKETRVCKDDPSHVETRFSGEYATGTTGLVFELINENTAYQVIYGDATGSAVYIPMYHRPNADSEYLPVTRIEDLQGKTNITSITIPISITSIRVFGGCTSLTSIIVDPNNSHYSSEGGVLYNKTKTELINAPGQSNVTIPTSVTSIRTGAFAGNTNITSIVIPTTITSIGSRSFGDCVGIVSITIPASVTFVGVQAFGFWESSQTINIEGHASHDSADAAWDEPSDNPNLSWRGTCDAVINYLGQ